MRAFRLSVAVMLLWLPLSALAQQPRGQLQVTVLDQTGGVLPGATVTISPADASTTSAFQHTETTAEGIAAFSGLTPGRYVIKAEFPGFEAAVNLNVDVHRGENKQTLTLPIQKLADTVTVQRDKQAVALDRSTTFGSALTREQIDALSDDPNVLRQQLQDMAGGNAVIRVDSFEGAPLPPKAQIKSIHITRDGFAAENHNAGAFFIDIVTQPGIGPLRGAAQYGLRPGTLTGNSPFTPVKGPEQFQVGLLNVGGTLVKDKSSFSLNVFGTTQYTTPNLNIVKPTGAVAQALDVRTPRNSINVQGLLDYAVTRDQTLRIGFNELHNSANNLGIGAYDEPERAYGTTDTTTNLRVQLAGPLGRRMFTNTRLNVTQVHSDQASALEAPTIQVLDAFTSGGAQIAGQRGATSVTFASDLDYVRGRHSVRTGVLVNAGTWSSTLNSNYLGTYTFPSLAAFVAGRPSTYSRRIGNPAIGYSISDAGVYVQDDFRVKPSLTISPGVRYEIQQHLSDWKDAGPRIGVTWAPFKSGSTSVRASAGVFYDFLPQTTLEQVLRVDGTHEQELNIVDPSFPDAGTVGFIPPVNRYFLDHGLQSPRNTRLSTGVEHTFRQSRTFTVRSNVLYAYTRTEHAWRGLDRNAPIAGVRPDAAFANVVDVVPDASARQHQLTVGWNIGLPPQPPGNETPKFFTWKRFAIYGQEMMTFAHNNTDGDFAISPSGSLVDQWGRSVLDIPSRFTVNVMSMQIRRAQIQATVTQQSGAPFTETTGFDANADGVFNERPIGVARDTLRGADQWALSMYGNYTIALRRRATPVTGLVATQFVGSTVSGVGTFSDAVRYRISLIVQAQNLTNRANYVGYSGVLTSPFFGQPTAVLNPRRVTFDVAFNF